MLKQKVLLSGGQIQNFRFPICQVLEKHVIPFTSAPVHCQFGFIFPFLFPLTLSIDGLEEAAALELSCELFFWDQGILRKHLFPTGDYNRLIYNNLII